MGKTRNWSELRATMSPERLERIDRETQAILAAMPLAEIRKARELTQEQIAETLDMPQGNVFRGPRRTARGSEGS